MKHAHDLAHAKRTTAWALLLDGAPAGTLVANYSDNPQGSTCTATVRAWLGPLGDTDEKRRPYTGRASGYGYDKLSAAVYDALRRRGVTLPSLGHGTGRNTVRRALEMLGYGVVEVLS